MERHQQCLPKYPSNTTSLRVCTVRLSGECRRRGGRFESARKRGKAPLYCPECAELRGREQSKLWKREKRKHLGAAEYRRQYGSAYDSEQQRERWREQKRRQRERRRARESQVEMVRRRAA